MNKQIVFAIGFALGACSALWGVSFQNAQAQNTVSANVGNPDSNNTVLIKETYGVISAPTQPMQAPVPANVLEPLPDSPGVEVAPPPGQVPENQTQNPATDTPQDQDIEIEEMIETD